MKKTKVCPICGTEMKIDTSAVCTSIPPKYRCVCPSCNCLDFIKTSEYDQYKEEPSLPGELEEAAEKYRRESYRKSILPNIDGPTPEYGGSIKAAFKAGEEWQKAKMMKGAVEIEVKEDAGGYPIVPLDAIELYDYENDKPLAKAGDKVKVIVIKED